MKVLAIETSCDETAAAILEKNGDSLKVLANVVSSQTIHAKWGGVVPNLAAREHTKNIVPVIESALEQAARSLGSPASKLLPQELDLLAVTQGPGLMPALLVGVTTAKTLALIWQKPLLGIQHIEGHIYANMIREISNDQFPISKEMKFPLLALVVSGGHTELVLMCDHFQYEVLGETQDDAAGEAFDKAAKMLGLPYPGGPEIAKRADAFSAQGGPALGWQVKFPRPMIKSHDYNFSFSGLKTAVLYFLKKNEDKAKDKDFIAQVSHEFQEAIVDVLLSKTKKALEEYSPATFVIAGGVSANVRLRSRLEVLLRENFPATQFFTPPFQYSLDNAAMIGAAALFRYEHTPDDKRLSLKRNSLRLEPSANLPLQSL